MLGKCYVSFIVARKCSMVSIMRTCEKTWSEWIHLSHIRNKKALPNTSFTCCTVSPKVFATEDWCQSCPTLILAHTQPPTLLTPCMFWPEHFFRLFPSYRWSWMNNYRSYSQMWVQCGYLVVQIRWVLQLSRSSQTSFFLSEILGSERRAGWYGLSYLNISGSERILILLS